MNAAAASSVPEIEDLSNRADMQIEHYVAAASAYVLRAPELDASQKKAGQIRLSAALGKILANDLRQRVPWMEPFPGEREVSGALRIAKADVSELHDLDGLRLAVEIKPVNLAVGRAIWNRFGDIRMFAVNLHLKFPFAVLGGVLVIPTWELAKTGSGLAHKSTLPLIDRVIDRLSRAGGRRTEGDAAHLLEGIGVVVYDPDEASMSPDVPKRGSGLRWEEFVESMAETYEARFEQ
ncbi:MAG: hypothetical protein IIA90_01175 [Chloroflexi bacterium]|nr:hypothetical protein [Chloroflexota bacterium]